jgi:cytochrome c-type biogenesis protein
MISNNEPNHKSKKRLSKLQIYIALFVGTVLLALASPYFGALYDSLSNVVAQIEAPYQRWLEQQNTSNPVVLIPLAFLGGLLASISPCILSLLPVNLSYIGTLNIKSRRDALFKAGQFVLGVVTIFSLLGLFASFASLLLVEFRGHINVVVGAIILLMGLSFSGLFHLPLPQTNFSLPIKNPYGVGLTFALVSSPCSSPVLFAVIAAAAATGSQFISTVTMVAYGLGYTAVLFFASLFAGFALMSRTLLTKSDAIIRFGSVALILAGGYYLITGIGWFL